MRRTVIPRLSTCHRNSSAGPRSSLYLVATTTQSPVRLYEDSRGLSLSYLEDFRRFALECELLSMQERSGEYSPGIINPLFIITGS